ncbi:MAG: S8 family serine peptidase [Gammaproteobacteria bacterium]
MKKCIIFHASICLFLIFLFSSLVSAQPPNQGTPNKFLGYAPDRVLVAFEQGTLGAEKKALHAQLGASVLKTIATLGVDVVQVPAGTVLDKVNLYDKNPNVRYAEPDYYRLFWFPTEGAEPFAGNMFNEQWALNNTGQKMTYCDLSYGCLPLDFGYVIGTPGADIDAPEAWDIGRSNPNIKIAILDSGIDWTSIDLDGKYLPSEAVNYVQSYENTLEDKVGHGTHVAGIAAAECDNSVGVAGVACSASLVSLKVCYRYEAGPFDPLNGAGVCPASAVAEAIAHTADPNGDGNTTDHYQIANMSFGTDIVINAVWNGLQGYSATEESAVNTASNAGVLLVAAAGNDGTSDKNYPAAYANVFAVGATDEDDFKASFSNYGIDWVSVGAPGNYIWSVLPNALCGLPAYSSDTCLWPYSGTSMASPHVSGAAAVVLSYLQNNGLAKPPINSQVQCHIEQGADQIGVQGLDYSVLYFKYGRLNLYGALQYFNACDGSFNSVPAAPSGLTASNSFSGRGKTKKFIGIYLKWTNNANNAENYRIERCNASVSGPKRQKIYSCNENWNSLASNVPVNQTFYLDDSTSTNRAYLYRVTAVNGAEESLPSNEAGVTTPAQ